MSDRCQQARAARPAANPKVRRILQAARSLFMRHGYGATCMDAVAEAAGVSKVTVYTYFKCKSTLFAGVIAVECAHCQQRLALPDVERLEIEKALLRIGCNLLGFMVQPRVVGLFRIVIAEIVRFPELGKIFYESGPEITVAGMADYLKRMSDRGQLEISDPVEAAHQFMALVRGQLHLRSLLGFKAPTENERRLAVEHAVQTFLRAYTAPI